MAQVNIGGGRISETFLETFKLKTQTRTLAADLTLTTKDAPVQFIDPGGAARNVTLPAEASSEGLVFFIQNTADAAEVLTVRDDTPATVVTPTQNEGCVVYCDGTTWHGFVGAEA